MNLLPKKNPIIVNGEINAVKEYEDAIFQLEHNKISLGKYESLIEPLKHLYAVKPYTEKMMVNGEEIDIDPVSYEVGLTKGMMESQPKQGENIGTDYAECDQFICSECGIHLQGWVRIDEDDYDDGIVHEYEFRFCPNCGAKMKGADDE